MVLGDHEKAPLASFFLLKKLLLKYSFAKNIAL
jgi:hypothetical protein